MASQLIYLRDDLHARLRQEDNMSQLVGKLLDNHYSQGQALAFTEEDEIILKRADEIRRKMENIRNKDAEEQAKKKHEEDIEQKIAAAKEKIAKITEEDEKEYREGLKEGKWRTYLEWANKSI